MFICTCILLPLYTLMFIYIYIIIITSMYLNVYMYMSLRETVPLTNSVESKTVFTDDCFHLICHF